MESMQQRLLLQAKPSGNELDVKRHSRRGDRAEGGERGRAVTGRPVLQGTSTAVQRQWERDPGSPSLAPNRRSRRLGGRLGQIRVAVFTLRHWRVMTLWLEVA